MRKEFNAAADYVTSRQNPKVQHIRKLLSSRKYRWECDEYAADGVKLLDEALRWNAGVKTVVLSEKLDCPPLPEGAALLRIPETLMAWLSPMQTPQGALFVCALPEGNGEAAELRPGTLLLDGLQDPGNVGTILRTADALDVPVVLTDDCADPYGHKTVRASMGAVFRVRPQTIERAKIAELCRAAGIPLAVTALTDDAADIRAARLADCVTVIGSEGQGVSRELLNAADRRLIIPMNPHCESLNAAAAAAIVLWELRRGRAMPEV